MFHAAMPVCDKQPGSPVVYEPCTILASNLEHAQQMCQDTGFVLMAPPKNDEGDAWKGDSDE